MNLIDAPAEGAWKKKIEDEKKESVSGWTPKHGGVLKRKLDLNAYHSQVSAIKSWCAKHVRKETKNDVSEDEVYCAESF